MHSNNPAVKPTRPDAAFGLDFRPRNPVHPSPRDWRDVVVYQVVLDRFDDGKDHPPYKAGETKTGRDKDQGWRFQGGTIKGLTRRLDYIKNLGARAIWVSSPLKQRATTETYHGYAVQDFLDIDPRFGTTEDFREFVKAAHEREMWVILDIVIEHAGDVFRYAKEGRVVYDDGQRFDFGGWNDGDGKEAGDFGPDDAIWPREFQDPNAFMRRGEMGDVGEASAAEAKEGDFMALKKLDVLNPKILGALINCYKYWIAVADVDGFRIDAMRHVHHSAASDFVHAIREYALSIGKHNFMQVGEVASDNEEMRRYVGSNVELIHSTDRNPANDPDNTADYPNLDAVLDFSYHNAIVPLLRNEAPATMLAEVWEARRSFYRDYGHSGKYYLTYVENHDLGAWDHRRLLNNTHEQTPDGYDRPGGDPRLAEMAAAVLLCSMGIPCLYYGTEQGFDGGIDDGPDIYVREAMFGGQWGPFDTVGASFFDDNHPIYQRIAKICEVRRQEPALRYGRQYLRDISGDGIHFGPPDHAGVFAFSRVLDVTAIVIVANPSLDPIEQVCVSLDRNLNPPGWQMRNLLDGEWRQEIEETDDGLAFIRLSLPPRGVAVLRLSID